MNRLKKLPSHEKSEMGLIGSVLLDAECFYKINLQSQHFFKKRNQDLWEKICAFWNTETNPDNGTFANYLEKTGDLSKIGGYDYLGECTDEALVVGHTEFYANQILDAYNRREQISICEQSIEDAYNGLDIADNTIAKLMGKTKEDTYDVKNIKDKWDLARQGKIKTIPTPYPNLDRLTGGIRQGMVTIFTGRSKSGKSMFLSHWYNYLGSRDIPALVVPLEDKYEITLSRMASNFGNLNLNELDRGGRMVNVNGKPTWDGISEKNLNHGYNCIDHVSKYPIHWYDKKCTPQQLRGVAIRMKKKYDIQVMFIDGAKDLLRPTGKYNDVGFDEEISQQMCLIAEELNIAVIAVHHLTKISDDDRINVNNIRGSGNIVGDSRAVYALQSNGISGLLTERGFDIVYDVDTGRQKNRIFECLVNNHGGTGMIPLVADLDRCQFKEQGK